MKLKVQVQYLQPGDIVGSGEKVLKIVNAGITIPVSKCEVVLENYNKNVRCTHWGKYTEINIDRSEKETKKQKHEARYQDVTDEDLDVNDYGP